MILIAFAEREGPDQAAHAQHDKGLRCPLTEVLNKAEYIDEYRRPWSDCAHAQAELDRCFAYAIRPMQGRMTLPLYLQYRS